MDTLRRLPTHGDGLLDIREPARTLPGTMVNEITDTQADMACEDGATARNGYGERGLAPPRRRHRAAHPQAARGDVIPGGPDREVLARGPRRRSRSCGLTTPRRGRPILLISTCHAFILRAVAIDMTTICAPFV